MYGVMISSFYEAYLVSRHQNTCTYCILYYRYLSLVKQVTGKVNNSPVRKESDEIEVTVVMYSVVMIYIDKARNYHKVYLIVVINTKTNNNEI